MNDEGNVDRIKKRRKKNITEDRKKKSMKGNRMDTSIMKHKEIRKGITNDCFYKKLKTTKVICEDSFSS